MLSSEKIIELARTTRLTMSESTAVAVSMAEDGLSAGQIEQAIEAWATNRGLEQQTLHGRFREFRDAWNNFVLEVGHALGLDRLCDWLARMIRRLTPPGE